MSVDTAELHQMAALGRLSVGIAHEINSPIGSVLSNNTVLRRCMEELQGLLANPQPESLEKAIRMVATCRRLTDVDRIACDRIKTLVAGVKRFARLDEGGPQPTDINRELRDTVMLATCQFRTRVKCELDLAEIPEVVAYPQRLNQVFLNLLVNSAQAIESEGKITVRTERQGDTVHISFADNGRGMTAEQKAHVFQPGFTTKARGEGTGFGLSMSREIIEEEHGGSMSFESEAGAGATFHILLPLKRSNGQ